MASHSIQISGAQTEITGTDAAMEPIMPPDKTYTANSNTQAKRFTPGPAPKTFTPPARKG